MRKHSITQAPRLLVNVAALLFLMSLSVASHTGVAHAASAPQAAIKTGQVTFTVNGKTYQLTKGTPLKVATIWPDGSRGFLVVEFGAASPIAPPSTITPKDPCTKKYYGIKGTNIYGGTLWQYVLYQTWCYDYNVINSYQSTFALTNAYLGWSLANHRESLSYEYSWGGEDAGIFRFNGPFGIGCSSGYVYLYFWPDGSIDGSVSGTAGEFGC